jgi:hypothetical protein
MAAVEDRADDAARELDGRLTKEQDAAMSCPPWHYLALVHPIQKFLTRCSCNIAAFTLAWDAATHGTFEAVTVHRSVRVVIDTNQFIRPRSLQVFILG